ncbi:MAG: HEAT repeat domain-containing protein, partial [bacterium]|nr:HEAT repeat domain-containing protein [bacterium]
PLMEAMSDNSIWVRRKVCEALGELKDPRAIEAIEEALIDLNIEEEKAAEIIKKLK